MPNYCFNSLTVTGHRNDIDAFLDRAKGEPGSENEDFSFDSIVPVPDMKGEDEAYQEWLDAPGDRQQKAQQSWGRVMETSYGWRLRNWGTKWDACEPEVGSVEGDDEDAAVTIRYDAAWSPNTPWVKTASEVWPGLHFSLEYEEPNMCFCGVFEAEGGVVLEDESWEYEPDYEEEDEDDQDDAFASYSEDPADDDLPF